jgi:hypothetical protein
MASSSTSCESFSASSRAISSRASAGFAANSA